MKAQLHCPKCKAQTVNVNVSDIIAANGRVTCAHCGHERVIKELTNLSPCGIANLGLDTERFKSPAKPPTSHLSPERPRTRHSERSEERRVGKECRSRWS